METLLPDAGLVEVVGAGHYSYLEQPNFVYRVLDSYFGVKMTDILLFALLSLFYLAAGIMLFIKYVHIFQLNSYKPQVQRKWVRDNIGSLLIKRSGPRRCIFGKRAGQPWYSPCLLPFLPLFCCLTCLKGKNPLFILPESRDCFLHMF